MEKKTKERDFQKVIVVYRESSTGGEALDPSDRWSSRADTLITAEVEEVLLPGTDPRSCYWESVAVADAKEMIKKGDHIYLVVVRYSDGGTFGHSSGHMSLPIGFLDRDLAYDFAEKVRQKPRTWPKKAAFGWDGYCSWDSYFGGLEYVEVERHTV